MSHDRPPEMLVAPDLQQRSDPRVCRVDTAQLGPGPGAGRAEGLEPPWHKTRRLPPRAAGWGRGQEAFRSLLISSSSVWFLFVFLFKAQRWNK